jgi:hypothetical protein
VWDTFTFEALIARTKERLPRQELTAAEKDTFFVSD